MIWLVDKVLNCLKLVTLPMFFSWAFTYAVFLWMYICCIHRYIPILFSYFNQCSSPQLNLEVFCNELAIAYRYVQA